MLRYLLHYHVFRALLPNRRIKHVSCQMAHCALRMLRLLLNGHFVQLLDKGRFELFLRG